MITGLDLIINGRNFHDIVPLLQPNFGAKRNPSNFDGLLPHIAVRCLWRIHLVNGIFLVRSHWCAVHEGCCCVYSGFWLKRVPIEGELRYSIDLRLDVSISVVGS